MASRGRGRGRGKGAMNKVLLEQLGLQKDELVKEPLICPSETFPPLQFPPAKLLTRERNSERNYMLAVKKGFTEFYQNSEYYIIEDDKKPDIEKYSDRFRFLTNKPRLELDWSRLPKELWPPYVKTQQKASQRKLKVKVNTKVARSSRSKEVNVTEKLEELEIKEKEEEGGGEKKEDEKDEAVIEEGEEEEDIDEEMDEGTDYINSYFDNGENYLEEDGDALEEGGVFS